ncbi:Calpain-2 catalytic subunit, partial [Camelus dromedarius]
EILARVIPLDQRFQEDYAGIFPFQFWQYGECAQLVVDDRTPRTGSCCSALVGAATEGVKDFTGGIAEWHELRKAPPSLFRIIQKALHKGSLLGCPNDITSAAHSGAITFQKLVKGSRTRSPEPRRIKLEEEDQHQEGGKSGCTFLVGLIQKHRRRQRKLREDQRTFDFGICKVPEELTGQTSIPPPQKLLPDYQVVDNEIEANLAENDVGQDDMDGQMREAGFEVLPNLPEDFS